MAKKNIHKYKHPNTIRKEFLENRISWKFIEKKFNISSMLNSDLFTACQTILLLEILKELQYLNNSDFGRKKS